MVYMVPGRNPCSWQMVNGIRYAPPNFLRMNMYLELSRPAGDVSRWEKVFKRRVTTEYLTLTNAYVGYFTICGELVHCHDGPLRLLGHAYVFLSEVPASSFTSLLMKTNEERVEQLHQLALAYSYIVRPRRVRGPRQWHWHQFKTMYRKRPCNINRRKISRACHAGLFWFDCWCPRVSVFTDWDLRITS